MLGTPDQTLDFDIILSYASNVLLYPYEKLLKMKKQGLGIMKQKFMDYHIQPLYKESKLPSPESSERKTVVMYVCMCVCKYEYQMIPLQKDTDKRRPFSILSIN